MQNKRPANNYRQKKIQPQNIQIFHSVSRPHLILLIIALFFLFFRLYHLTVIPIFFDEALYVYWAKVISATHTHWFISLTDGKSPVPIWIMAAFISVFPKSAYLAAGRFPSVIAGFLTLIAVYKLAALLFSKRTAYLAVFLYTLSPFPLLYDRMALYDSYLNAATIWSVYFMLRTIKYPTWQNASLWGISQGLALLSKASSVLYWVILPFVYLIMVLPKSNPGRRKTYFGMIFISIVVAQIIHNFLIISHGYPEYLWKSLYFVPSKESLIFSPWGLFFTNLSRSVPWLMSYSSAPIFFLYIVGLVYLIWRRRHIGISFLILIVVPVLTFSFLGRVYFPRYLLFLTPLLIIPFASFLSSIKNLILRYSVYIFLIIGLFLQIKNDIYLLFDPPNSSIAGDDYYQYISGSPSGYGLKQIMQRIDVELTRGPLILAIEGSYSQYPNAFLLYYWGNPHIKIVERWWFNKIDPEIIAYQKTSRLFIVAHQNYRAVLEKTALDNLPLKILYEAKKPGGLDSIYLGVLDTSSPRYKSLLTE